MQEFERFRYHPSTEDQRLIDLVSPKELGEPNTLWGALCDRGWEPLSLGLASRRSIEDELRKFVHDLAWLDVYLLRTDHLSDAELYEQLYEIVSEYKHPIWPDDPESTVSIGFGLANCDTSAWLQFYASDADRLDWTDRFPEVPMPPKKLPLHRRDWLPLRPD